ncbi:MAG: hypothetical protein UU85_C0004G0073 [Candidatus Wolfebacteria bacterium GW2011_GWA2_42_10]|uniref:Uncharacterized protein n=2 Tax=Candidatus Wolfeibacteriota TaxID=1752735 RepID=A0A0G0XK92_9BACT|nr:MAG: hypothetical protein UU38_C0001G0134 [Candidatus Wolfebacteria bacterium GW2011_GWB1_41_12]KKS25314.1 MAG: hypothetical protein UU85_C0004G0073 [Candidatus Wolfebacteria bacterium GW2011_GWA2_42_10]KKT56753.1 MAG: hypothetical protein UW50_C0001G0322 [Candidatus Wolfebacteria bacterium GW2011_GWA1_44_24]
MTVSELKTVKLNDEDSDAGGKKEVCEECGADMKSGSCPDCNSPEEEEKETDELSLDEEELEK